MKRIFSMALLCALAGSLLAQPLTKENRTVPAFTGLDASGVFVIELRKGPQPSVVIEAEAQYMGYIKTEVSAGVLRLWFDHPRRVRMNIKTPLRAYITVSELNVLELSGACSLTTSDLFTPSRFHLDMSGATKLSGLRIQAGDADMEASGATKLSMDVQFERAAIKLSGAGMHNLSGTIRQVQMDVSGASKCAYHVKSERIGMNVSGSSKLDMQGGAAQVKMDISGAVSVQAGSYAIKELAFSASGASKADVHATDVLSVRMSGASKLTYRGDANLTGVSISSGASMSKR